jgi:tetratricopeptide (TPR) repeat protein
MKRTKVLVWMILFAVAPALSGCNWLRSRDAMNKGVRAYTETNFEAAVDYFNEALSYDPDVPNGELYLALSYARQYTAGLETPENMRRAEQAVEALEQVLAKEPENATAIAAIAGIYQNTRQLQRAREYYVLQTEASPEDPVAFYSVGSINWWILADQEIELSDQERQALIDEGQEYLDKALAMDPESTDAMAMKNLLYRQAANLIPEDTEDPELIARREELIGMADEWYDRTLEVRAQIAERTQEGLGVE